MKYLKTDRLTLRPFNLDDVEPFFKIFSSPAVMQYIGDGSPLTKTQTEACIKRWVKAYMG